MADDPDSDDDHAQSNGGDGYKVGYRKPPCHTRFKPGQSGNPKGRKKGTRGLKTDLHAELKARLSFTINGKPVSGTKQQLMMKTLTAKAASGDIRAAQLLISLIAQVFGFEDRGTDPRKLSPNDQAFLEAFLAGEASTPSAEAGPDAEAGGNRAGDKLPPPNAVNGEEESNEDQATR